MNDAAIRAAFEVLFPLPKGVEWRPEKFAYCVFIDAPRNGGWTTCNEAFHINESFKVWRIAAARFTGTFDKPSDEDAMACMAAYHSYLATCSPREPGFAIKAMHAGLNAITGHGSEAHFMLFKALECVPGEANTTADFARLLIAERDAYRKENSDLRLQCGGMEMTINELSEGK
jgi:hypothetical protein